MASFRAAPQVAGWWVLLGLLLLAQGFAAYASRGAVALQWVAMALITAASLVASLFAIAKRHSLAELSPGRVAALLIAAAALPRLAALFAQPMLDDDYFRFLWDGYQTLGSFAPYASAPSSHFDDAGLAAAWQAILSHINHPDLPTIYGPALQLVFAVSVALTGADPLGYRLLLVAADLAFIMYLRRAGVSPWWVFLYCVNALVLKELHYSLHPDGLIALALAVAVQGYRSRPSWFAAAGFATAITMKLPLALLAVVFVRPPTVDTLRFAAKVLGLSLLICLPFLVAAAKAPLGLESLVVFANEWRVNPLGFEILGWAFGGFARPTYAALLIAAALAVAWRAWAADPTGVAERAFFLLALAILLSPTVNAWYWVMPLALAMLVSRGAPGQRAPIAAVGVSFLLLLSYWNGSFERAIYGTSTLAHHQVHWFATALQCAGVAFAACWIWGERRPRAVATVLAIGGAAAVIGFAFATSLSFRSAASNWLIEQRFARVAQLSSPALLARRQGNAAMLLIDARTQAEFETSHIPGAYRHKDHAETTRQIEQFVSRHPAGDIVIYCAVGYRSSELADSLIASPILGDRRIFNLRGGVFTWAAAGGELVNSTGATRTVHPFNRFWDEWLARELPRPRAVASRRFSPNDY